MQGETEDIEFLARSETRVRLMNELHRDGTLNRDDLRSRFDASRTTIQRNLAALEDRGWVRNENRTYSLAPCGEMVADEFLDLVDTVSIADRLQPVLRWVDRTELDFDPELVADADVVTGKPGDPWAMVNRHVRRLRRADDVRSLLPLTGLHAMEVGRDRVVEHGATATHIATPSVVETFRTNPNYERYYDDLVETERYELYRYEDEIPYYLGIIDGVVQIGVDEDGEPRALLETRNDDVREWAVSKFRDYRTQADRVSAV